MKSLPLGPLRRWGVMGAILLVALIIRLASIRFGLPALHDPDELMFELGAIRMLSGPTLNPGWFGHPATITMYLLAVVNVLVFITGWLAGWFPNVKAFGEMVYIDPSWIILPGRVAMTAFALGTLVLSCRLGTRLVNRRTGVIAAGLLAISPVHITYSQIIRSDMMATFFMLAVILKAIDITESDRRRDHVLAALWLGLAITTKWPFALAALAVVGAMALRLADGRTTLRKAVIRLAAFGALSALFVVLLSPYLILDHATVIRNLTGEGQARHLGSTGGSFGQNALWYVSGPMRAGLGAVGLALLPAGTILLWRNHLARALVMPIIAAFFILLCSQTMVWERWALPLMPLCTILAAAVIAALWKEIRSPWRVALTAVLLLSLALPMGLRAQSDARERMNDTRQIASAWARRHIPPGSTVLVEHFAFDLIPQGWRFLFPIGDAGCVDAVGLLRGKTSYTPIDKARGTRSNLDYGTMAPSTRADCRPDYAILTQYDRYRLERATFPAEYAAYRELLARGRVVATIAPRAGYIGGRVVTIVAFDNTRR